MLSVLLRLQLVVSLQMTSSLRGAHSNRQLRALFNTSASAAWTEGKTHTPRLTGVCTGWSPVAPQAASTSVAGHKHHQSSLSLGEVSDSCALQL